MLLLGISSRMEVSGKIDASLSLLGDLHRSSGGSSATAGGWGIGKLSVFQNSSSEQITSSLQRTALPWLLEGFKDEMTFSCVWLVCFFLSG